MNGHVGACAPLHPQWQHWGELCAAVDVCGWDAPECDETGVEAEGRVEHDEDIEDECDEMGAIELEMCVSEGCDGEIVWVWVSG